MGILTEALGCRSRFQREKKSLQENHQLKTM